MWTWLINNNPVISYFFVFRPAETSRLLTPSTLKGLKWGWTCIICCIFTFSLSLRAQRPPEKCRYVVGSILCEGEEKPDEDLQKLYEKFGFKVFSMPDVSHAVTTSFPCTTPLSHVLGPYRVYPRIASYIEVHTLLNFLNSSIGSSSLLYLATIFS